MNVPTRELLSAVNRGFEREKNIKLRRGMVSTTGEKKKNKTEDGTGTEARAAIERSSGSVEDKMSMTLKRKLLAVGTEKG